VLFLEDLAEMVSQSLIEIFTSKMSITSSRDDLEHFVINGKKRYIEGTTTEIEDDNVLLS